MQTRGTMLFKAKRMVMPKLSATFLHRHMLPFKEAKVLARKYRFACAREYRTWAVSGERPLGLPSSPDRVYCKTGWAGWRDWLGTGIRRQPRGVILSFEQAREMTRQMGFRSGRDWRRWAASEARPMDIPSCPNLTYVARGWNGWGDWLGPTHRSSPVFRPFAEARVYVRGLGFKTWKEWKVWASTDARPRDIPKSPRKVYCAEWCGSQDWFGGGRQNCAKSFLSFEEARAWARGQRIRTSCDWAKMACTPARQRNVPCDPRKKYPDQWNGWDDWLGRSVEQLQDPGPLESEEQESDQDQS